MKKIKISLALLTLLLFFSCSSEETLSSVYGQFFLYTEEGEYQKAIDLLEDEIPIFNHDFRYHYSVGYCYSQTNLLGDTRNANKSLLKAYILSPSNYDNAFLLAKTFKQIQDVASAKKYFEAAIQLWETTDIRNEDFISEPYLEYAKILVREENYELAYEYIEKSLEINEYNSNALLIKGFVLAKLGSYDELAMYYEKAQEISPQEPKLKKDYGQMLIILDEYQKAYDFFLAINNDAELTKLDHYYAKIELGYLELLNENYKNASLYLKTEDIMGNYLEQKKYLIFYYWKTNDYKSAYREYKYYRVFQEDDNDEYMRVLFGVDNERVEILEVLEYFKDDVYFQKLIKV